MFSTAYRSAKTVCSGAIAILFFWALGLVASAQPLRAAADPAGPVFRTEKLNVDGGELITIIARRTVRDGNISAVSEIPLISVFKDTLDDADPANDRLRYLWLLTHAEPGFWQKLASGVPFYYGRAGNNRNVGSGPPKHLVDLNRPNPTVWQSVMWYAFRRIIVSDLSVVPRSGILQYRKNQHDHRQTAVAAALALLAVYQDTSGEDVLSEREIADIQAKLLLDGDSIGSRMQVENYARLVDARITARRDHRGHNWELLRQHAEQQGLIFDPIEMPDGSATHAILWIDRDEVVAGREERFDGRFLNIDDPWTDPSLKDWVGYVETRWFDREDRRVGPDHEGARPRTLIPLAVYGLDNPKIPVILVDFRRNSNPKFREMSRRVLNDVTNNVLSISKFSSMPYFLGRFLLDFTTSRRGVDFNQGSRMRSYAQLKTLIALDESLSEPLREEMAMRVESSTLNPRNNDLKSEIQIARRQYLNLMDYARRPDGLAKRIRSDRREEIAKAKSGLVSRTFHGFLRTLTFDHYRHRARYDRDNLAILDSTRRLQYHERIIREIAARSVRPEIDADLEALRASMDFITREGEKAGGKTARSLAKIFRSTQLDDIRELVLAGLYRINNTEAKSELLAIYSLPDLDPHWRSETAQYLAKARSEGLRISERDQRTIARLFPPQ